MNRKRKKKLDLDQSEGFGQSLGQALGDRFGFVSSDRPPIDENETLQNAATRTDIPKMRIKMNVSKKGRGGKTVTLCSGVECLDPNQRKDFSKLMSKALGTRVFWSEESLCVQGDLRDRLKTFFESQGHGVEQ